MHQEPTNPIQIFGILDMNYIQGHVFSSPVYGGQFFFWEPANGRLFCQLKHLFYYKDHHVSEPTLVTRICGPRRIVFPSIFWTRSVTLTYPSPRAWDFSFTGGVSGYSRPNLDPWYWVSTVGAVELELQLVVRIENFPDSIFDMGTGSSCDVWTFPSQAQTERLWDRYR